jgi:hypothetical protein
MKFLKILTLSALSLGLLSYIIYPKNDKKSTSTLDTLAMLINKNWKLSEESNTQNGQFVPASKNCSFTFVANGQLQMNNEATTEHDINNGNWSFRNHDPRRIDISLAEHYIADIIEVNETRLKWKYKNPLGEEVTQIYIAE